MSQAPPDYPVRIQLCGYYSVLVDGEPREDALPGKQGQRLLAYLVLYRRVPVERSQLIEVIWGDHPPQAADPALSALLSKVRLALGDELVSGRGVPAVRLPEGSWVDVEHALDSIHRSEALLAKGEYAGALGQTGGALYPAKRRFLSGHEGDWIDVWRRRLDDVHTRALAVYAEASLRLGGLELPNAERASRELVEKMPYRESAYALRMEVLEALGNTAEALLAYEQLRSRLADDLGASPGPDLQARHERLLRLM